jgi:chemotaxis protein methyltransferase WspC
VVVPETWFFRDPEAFTMLARVSHEAWLRDPSSRVLRLLSLPSSTGEEPYSMAMALVDAGVPADRFRIDAVDISRRVLTYADRGVYGKNSFRGQDLSFRDRHFDAMPDGYRLKSAVRRQVHFEQANLLAADFLPGQDIYDAVFCRNLLIYFDRPTQDRAVGVLARLLAPKSVLFVAPSETGLLLSHAFESAKVPLAFAFRKSGARPGRAAEPVKRPVTERAAHAAALPALPLLHLAPTRRADELPISPAVAVKAVAETGLDRATELADGGHFVEAAHCCEAHLGLHGPSAQAFYLMGLVHGARGDQTAAAEFYRKALYLAPDHHDALIHFALLLEQQGHADRALLLRNRARRAESAGRA